MKASVLPLPVCAAPRISAPRSACGIACRRQIKRSKSHKKSPVFVFPSVRCTLFGADQPVYDSTEACRQTMNTLLSAEGEIFLRNEKSDRTFAYLAVFSTISSCSAFPDGIFTDAFRLFPLPALPPPSHAFLPFIVASLSEVSVSFLSIC